VSLTKKQWVKGNRGEAGKDSGGKGNRRGTRAGEKTGPRGKML